MLFSKIWERKREQLKMGKWKMWEWKMGQWNIGVVEKCESKKHDIKKGHTELC